MAKLTNLHDLYIDELQDLYSAETQLTKALPKVIDHVSDSHLKKAIEEHLKETEKQRDIVAKVLQRHDEKPGGETCEAMKGLIEETEEMLDKKMSPAVCDAAIIACCQRVEHYEMAGYGTVRAFAQVMGHDEDYKDLSTIFEQEENADETLTDIAVERVNPAANDKEMAQAK